LLGGNGTILIPIELIFTGVVLALVAALGAVSYAGYHRWNARGRFTSDTLYHAERAHFGFMAFSLSGLFLFLLVLVLGVDL
jgi:ABC-type transport system involved in cytochrome c biogenesis permease subunit